MRHDDPFMAGNIPRRDRQVRVLIEAGRIDDANALFDEITEPIPNRVDTPWPRSTTLAHRALLAWRLDRIPLAMELAAESWTELDITRPDEAATAETTGMLGYLLESLGHHRAAQEMMWLSVQAARQAGTPQVLAHCLQLFAGILLFRAAEPESDTAHTCATAQPLAEEALALVGEGYVYRALLATKAGLLAGLGKFDDAERIALDALELSDEADDRWTVAVTNWVLASVHRARADANPARFYAERAVNEAERINDTMLLLRISVELAEICAELDDPAGEAAALRRTVVAGRTAVRTLHAGLGQALEHRRVAVQAQRLAVAAQEAAARDPLTGLVNRRGLEGAAPGLLEQTAPRGKVPWLILIDVDHFKNVNDSNGHPAGDLVLREIAGLLRRECRTEDLVCRWAGDEFVVLLVDAPDDGASQLAVPEPGTSEATGPKLPPGPAGPKLPPGPAGPKLPPGPAGPMVAERIRTAIDTHHWTTVLGDIPETPTVSVGVAAGPAHLDDLFTAADTALYRAKRAGRNRVEVAPAPTFFGASKEAL